MAVEEGGKLGLVGRNGAGKSTLLQLLSSALTPDGGSVEYANGARVGMTSQSLYSGERGSVSVEEEIKGAFSHLAERERELEELEQRIADDPSPELIERYGNLQSAFERDGGYEYRARAASALSSLGFDPEDWGRPAGSFSGGEQSRIALARLLLEEPDLVLLDEPTNHLDLSAIEWLENLVKNAKSAFLVVSHDRHFLDTVCQNTLELKDGRIERYPGGYSAYRKQKEARRQQDERRAKAVSARRRQLETFIEKNRAKPRKASQARNKQKQLDRMPEVEVEREDRRNIHLDLDDSARAGRVVLEVEGVSHGFEDDDGLLLNDIDLVIERGEKVALLGKNGVGKSTLMGLAAGEVLPSEGSSRLGHNVGVGYQDQQLSRLDGGKTVLDEVVGATGFDPPEARDLLGAFMFSGEEVFKKVSSLSGGEKNRLSLAEIVAGEANFLLLDEPTNDLDIPAREALEEALASYRGTLLFVSHDRYFLRRLATRVVELENGELKNYPGGYDYYLSHRRLDAKEGKSPRKRVRPGMSKEQNTLASRLVAVEGEIDATERRIAHLEKEMATSELYANGERSRQVVTEHRQLKRTLDGLYEDWESLLTEAEEAEI